MRRMDFQNSVWAKVPKDISDHGSEPVAAIGDPPTHKNYRDGGQQCPPKREYEISRQAQHGEADPEDLSLHGFILVLAPAFLSSGKRIKRCHDAFGQNEEALTPRGRRICPGPRSWRWSGRGRR